MALDDKLDDVKDLLIAGEVNLAAAPRWIRMIRMGYEVALLGAAVASAWLLVIDRPWVTAASWALWAWFALDYLVRLVVADDRREYVATHRIELVAALPLDFFRPLRALRLLRPLAIIIRATRGIRDVLGLHGVTLIATIGITVVIMGGAVLTWLEPETADLGDGLWWSLVTTTTVGYGDISPVTVPGRMVAGILMIAGIGLLGALTGEVAQRLTSRMSPASSGNPDVDHLIVRLQGWDDLEDTERLRLAGILRSLAETHGPAIQGAAE